MFPHPRGSILKDFRQELTTLRAGGIFEDLFYPAGFHNPSVGQQGHLIGNLPGKTHLMRHEDAPRLR